MAKKKNVSIRFNEDHLDYALKKTGIGRAQALVDFLLSDIYNAGNPKENPFSDEVLSRKFPGGGGKPVVRYIPPKKYDNPASTLMDFNKTGHLSTMNIELPGGEIKALLKEVECLPTYNEILNLAKSGAKKDTIEELMSKNTKLTAGQKEMIRSKFGFDALRDLLY